MRTLLLLVLLAASAFAQVTISDTLKIAQGPSTWKGTMTVCSQDEVWQGNAYARWCQTYSVTNGAISVVLIPGVGVYRVAFRSQTGTETWNETWRIASESTPQTLAQVRVQLPGQTATPAAAFVRSLFSATAPVLFSASTGVISLDAGRALPAPTGQGGKAVRVNTGGTGYELVTSEASVAWGAITGSVTAQTDLAAYIAAAFTAHTHPASAITSGVLGTARLGSGTASGSTVLFGDSTWQSIPTAAIASASKTGSGSKVATAASTPSNGCAKWLNGDLDSTGLDCGTGVGGGGTTTSVASATASFTGQTSVAVTHNFNSLRQVVACYNGSAQQVFPNSVTTGLSSTTITFTGAQTGSCTVLGGTGLYSQAFTTQTSVSLTHSLGTQAVIVACYDGSNQQVVPNTVVATSTSAATVTFSTEQTGSCVVASSLGLSGGGGSGSVTSVGLTMPSGFSVSGTPVTGAGTLSVTTALNGLVSGTGSGFAAATASNVVALWAGGACSGFLKHDGTCSATSGGGTTYTAGDGIDAAQLAAGVAAVDTTVPAVAVSGSQSLTFGAINQSSCSVQTITATGATIGDRVIPGWPATLPDGLIGVMHVTATNAVSVRLCKLTTGAADVTGLTFTYQIVRAR